MGDRDGNCTRHGARSRAGNAQTLLASIRSLTHNLSLSIEQAMDALDVPVAERDRYRALLAGDGAAS